MYLNSYILYILFLLLLLFCFLSITIIYIIDNNIGDKGLEYLSYAVQFSLNTLEVINISGCNISDSGLEVFCNSIIDSDHKNIISIYLSHNNIQSLNSISKIFKMNGCPNLSLLDLSYNLISSDSFNVLLKTLLDVHYTDIQYLYYEGNKELNDNYLFLLIDLFQAGCLKKLRYMGFESIYFIIFYVINRYSNR